MKSRRQGRSTNQVEESTLSLSRCLCFFAGIPVVNARLHFTPNPCSTPGTNRTVRLAHHVGHQAGLAESRLIEHSKASKTLRRSVVNHRGGPLLPPGVTATQPLD